VDLRKIFAKNIKRAKVDALLESGPLSTKRARHHKKYREFPEI
jgi:hypothetical protein